MKYYLRFDSIPDNENQEVFKLLQYYYHGGSFSDEGTGLNQGDIINGIDPRWYNNNGCPLPEKQDQFQHFIKSRWYIDQRIYDPFEKAFHLVLSWTEGDVDDL